MNIFFLDSDPQTAASFYCNRRCVKIILEIAQMLCTAYNAQGLVSPYKSAHINHSMSKWVRYSKENFVWTIKHGLALCSEYTNRYNKIHKCEEIIKWCESNLNNLKFENQGWTEPPRCFGEYKDVIDNSLSYVEAYREYYRLKPLCVWPNGKQPDWWYQL